MWLNCLISYRRINANISVPCLNRIYQIKPKLTNESQKISVMPDKTLSYNILKMELAEFKKWVNNKMHTK